MLTLIKNVYNLSRTSIDFMLKTHVEVFKTLSSSKEDLRIFIRLTVTVMK